MNFEIQLFDDKERGTMACLAQDSHISRWCCEQQSIVSDQTVPLKLLPLIKPGDTVVDVGAFIGDHTVAYAESVGADGKVFAFEPYLPAFVCLVFNCRKLPQVWRYRCALGAGTGTVHLSIPPHDNMGMVSVDKNSSELPRVVMMTLDGMRLESCAFIKIDAEGFEPEVIRGALETIKRCQPVMFIELNDAALQTHGFTKDSVFELLRPLGYSHEFVDPLHTLEEPQLDVIMRPL